MKNKLIYIFLTGFYSGKSKYMPGTFGTLVGVLIFQLISFNTLYENIFVISTISFFYPSFKLFLRKSYFFR